jgi:hypothetical protein
VVVFGIIKLFLLFDGTNNAVIGIYWSGLHIACAIKIIPARDHQRLFTAA